MLLFLIKANNEHRQQNILWLNLLLFVTTLLAPKFFQPRHGELLFLRGRHMRRREVLLEFGAGKEGVLASQALCDSLWGNRKATG